jgi:hypothetical protein
MQCVANLEEQFGRLEFSKKVQWQFTQGLLLA